MVRRFAIVLSLCCLVVAPPRATAQVRLKEAQPNEISLSYGVSLLGLSMGTVAAFANRIGDIADFLVASSGDNVRVHVGGSQGIYNLGYSYTVNKTWQFGMTFGYNKLNVEHSDNTGSYRPIDANLFNIMNTAQVNWFRVESDMFGMYSKGAIGVWIAQYGLMVDTADEQTGTKFFFPAFQLSAVCLEIGKSFSGFLELGVGMQGIVQTGMRVRF